MESKSIKKNTEGGKMEGMTQRGVIVFGGGLDKQNAIREAEDKGYFVMLPFGGNHAELYIIDSE